MSNNLYYLTYSKDSLCVKLWRFDPTAEQVFTNIPIDDSNTIQKGYQMMQVGNYVLQWGEIYNDYYPYQLFQFNPKEKNILGSYTTDSTTKKTSWSTKPFKQGSWNKLTFFGSKADFANPDGAKKNYANGTDLTFVSIHNFVLNWIPDEGRGTYQLFNFDPLSTNPLPNSISGQGGGWLTINDGHELIHSNGYILDWQPKTSDYSIWQFDAQSPNVLSYPAIVSGNWKDLGINEDHQLTAIADYILDTNLKDGSYRLWRFDQYSKTPLEGPLTIGTLPDEFGEYTNLVPMETLIEIDYSKKDIPGTIDFMRDKIEHVVYYMLENRSFDHMVGWLYENKDKINVIGPAGPYKGVDPNYTNELNGKEYHITQYNDGKLSLDPKFQLDLDQQDPYHDNSDVLRQCFSQNIQDYFDKKVPDMRGFALNNGTEEVMLGYSPEQLPVLNGLAENFAISDEWFCSHPGSTDSNRAFSVTGSSLGQLNNFQNGVQFSEWSDYPHRPSVWKTLWCNGMNSVTDFKIYNSIEWMNFRLTYKLFLQGQIPTIDTGSGGSTLINFCPSMNQFFDDVKYGTLPKFAYLEPKWVAALGSTSYHPGNDLIPGERGLKDIFDAIQASPSRDKIMLIVTFDEHGGLPDHVPPPYAQRPYANDSIDGFDFDLMGIRVPTIVVSPYIKKNTVFRSSTGTAYESTSILSTLLQWCGIPKSRWGMAERTNRAPSFENILQEETARQDIVNLKVPYDSSFPPIDGENEPTVNSDLKIHNLHRLLIPGMIKDLTPDMDKVERNKIIDELINNATTQNQLIERIKELANK